jgi:hypothetical protein
MVISLLDIIPGRSVQRVGWFSYERRKAQNWCRSSIRCILLVHHLQSYIMFPNYVHRIYHAGAGSRWPVEAR